MMSSFSIIHSRMFARLYSMLLSSCLVSLTLCTVSQAKVPSVITSDGTLGTKVTQQGRVHTITGGKTAPGRPESVSQL